MSKRLALIIGNSVYEDTNLARLVTPDADVLSLAEVLRDARIGTFDEVTTLVNQPAAAIRRAIAGFFAGRGRDDLLLVYFSGHGIRDDQGQLFLAANDTEHTLLRGTAIPASFITEEMDNSRSRRQVLILDCCHSGAFSRGMKAATGGSVGTATAFEGTGSGRVVLTATDSTQYAWEGDQVTGQAENSVFTRFLIQGLRSGDADIDADGDISLDELYDYAYEQVIQVTPLQTPGKWSYGQQGDLIIARNPKIAPQAAAPISAVAPTAPAHPAEPRPVAKTALPSAVPKTGINRLPRWAWMAAGGGLVAILAGSLLLSNRSSPSPAATTEAAVLPAATEMASIVQNPSPATPAQVSSTQATSAPTVPSQASIAEGRSTETAAPTDQQIPVSGGDLPASITDDQGVTMVLVPAGNFQYGSDMGEPDEQPSQKVYLDEYYIDQYEVTNARYAACVQAGVCAPPDDGGSNTHEDYYHNSDFADYPVIFINWQAAQTYCEWRGGSLPTEAQWEKAGRGTDGRTYPWGEGASCSLANLYPCVGDVAQVGSYPEAGSPFNLMDMSGNVWEWTADWYSEDYYHTLGPEVRNPAGPESGKMRVIRGGSWADDRYQLRLTERFYFNPLGSDNALGFRCARTP